MKFLIFVYWYLVSDICIWKYGRCYNECISFKWYNIRSGFVKSIYGEGKGIGEEKFYFVG